MGSSRVNPVAAITIPLTITARAPKVSEATSRNAPRTLRLCACPRRSSSSDTPFPASATTPKTIIRPEPTGGGAASRWTASTMMNAARPSSSRALTVAARISARA